MIIGLVCVILAPIFGQLMQLALSRRREYLADATSVEFTRNPDGLISALEKLDNDKNQLKTANNATAHMYIVDPFKSNLKDGRKKSSSLFSTHPSIEDRVEAIKAAINMADKKDIIVLAGKGHEPYQEINGVKYPFDERVIVNSIIK